MATVSRFLLVISMSVMVSFFMVGCGDGSGDSPTPSAKDVLATPHYYLYGDDNGVYLGRYQHNIRNGVGRISTWDELTIRDGTLFTDVNGGNFNNRFAAGVDHCTNTVFNENVMTCDLVGGGTEMWTFNVSKRFNGTIEAAMGDLWSGGGSDSRVVGRTVSLLAMFHVGEAILEVTVDDAYTLYLFNSGHMGGILNEYLRR